MELRENANAQCGELGVKSLDFEACTWECNEEPSDPCDGVHFDAGSLTVEALEACADINITPDSASWSLNWGDGDPDDSGDGDAVDVCNTYPKAGQWQAFLALFAPGPNGPKCDTRPFQVTTTCPEGLIEQEDGTCLPVCPPPGEGLIANGAPQCVPYCEVFPDADVCQPQEPEECIYEIAGNQSNKQEQCEEVLGGFWSDGSQHCVLDFPGVNPETACSADFDWNLTPGQSATGCFKKQSCPKD